MSEGMDPWEVGNKLDDLYDKLNNIELMGNIIKQRIAELEELREGMRG